MQSGYVKQYNKEWVITKKMTLEDAEITFRKMWGFKQLAEKVFVN